MPTQILQKLHTDLEQAATDLTPEEQEALLAEIQALIQQHLDGETEDPEHATLKEKLQAQAIAFKAHHPTLADSFVFAVNSLNNAGL
jgi:hypothetical protein